MFCKKGVLKVSQNSRENTCSRVSFIMKLLPEACNFVKKQTLAQVFSCEFCDIFKNTFFNGTPLVAASDDILKMIERYSDKSSDSLRIFISNNAIWFYWFVRLKVWNYLNYFSFCARWDEQRVLLRLWYYL